MSLRCAVDEVATALAGGSRTRISGAFTSIPLPSDFDPRSLLSLGAPVVASYERPDHGFALVGIGEAARIDLAVGEAPTAARSGVRELLGDVATLDHPELRPRLMGGFRFAPDDPAEAPWTRFSSGSLVLPRFLFVLDGERVGVVVEPNTDPLDAQSLIEEGLERGLTDDLGTELGLGLREVHSVDETAWRDSVRTIAAEIRDGAYEKAVLATSVELEGETELPLGTTLAQLRADYPDCHVASFTAGDATIVCASPELLINLEGGRARTLALAASQRRGHNPAEDCALGSELLADAKSRVEHEVVVREIVEGLEGAIDALEVDSKPSVRRFRNIQHLATEVAGSARDGVDVLELVERLHPTPAVCGRPRDIARRVIGEHEPFDRGWYSGPIGWLDAQGEGEFAVALRTALISDRRAWLFAGNGIMGDSDPQVELAEVRLKLRPLAEALGGRVETEASAIPV